MWNGILWAGLDMLVRSLIMQGFGAEAAGNYQAAWTFTGVFANVVLSGMASDFFPRLVGMIDDEPQAARAINQQTEIGVLLALPSLFFAAAFAPIIVKILYSAKFDAASGLLTWMAFGVFFRVVCWPMWYVQLAKGASHWFAATQTISVGAQAALTVLLLERYGVVGAAYAYVCAYHDPDARCPRRGRKLIGATWDGETVALVLLSAALIGGGGALRLFASETVANIGGAALCALRRCDQPARARLSAGRRASADPSAPQAAGRASAVPLACAGHAHGGHGRLPPPSGQRDGLDVPLQHRPPVSRAPG